MNEILKNRNDIRRKDRPIFIAIIFLPVLLVWRDLTNDVWFLLNSGRYVVQQGIPVIEPFTLHQGFEFVMQQWLSAVIFWGTYSAFGIAGLKLLVVLFFALTVFVLYRLCMKLSGNYFFVSAIITFGASLLFGVWLSCRPFLFSTLIFMLEVYFLESFIQSKKKHYLFFIPILSILLINLHASMWPIFFILLGPYIIDAFRFKMGKISGQGYEKKTLLIVTGVSLAAGLANPYGWQGMTYLKRSYGHPEISQVVAEMRPPTVTEPVGVMVFLAILLVFLAYLLHRTGKTNVRYVLLTFGTAYMALSSQRSAVLFAVCAGFPLAEYLKNLEVNISQEETTRREHVLKSALFVLIIAVALMGFFYQPETFKQSSAQLTELDETIDTILAEGDVNSIVLYTGYDDGSYAEFMGLKPYIDPRAEVFVIENNQKDDVMQEYYDLQTGRLYYRDFLAKYQFTHLIVTEYDILYIDLLNDTDYQLAYSNDSYSLFEKK